MARLACRTCALPVTRDDLQDTIQLFTCCQSQSDCVAAVRDIATCLGSNQPLESPPYNYHERRKGNEQQITFSTIYNFRL